MTTGLALLRVPFPPNQISYLPKGGVKLAYVGHAALTDRLLDADPAWTWEPLSMAENGLPVMDDLGGMWIRLTVCGVTRLGYGHAGSKTGGDAIKEVIGDALRNAAMRFGAALDLWHKGELHAEETPPARQQEPDPWQGWTPDQAKKIRLTAQECIAAFTEGREFDCYASYSSMLGRATDQDMRMRIQLALSAAFQNHAALRASLKKMEEAERAGEFKEPVKVEKVAAGPGLKKIGVRATTEETH